MWFLASDRTGGGRPGVLAIDRAGSSPDVRPVPRPSHRPTRTRWSGGPLPVYECDLQIAFVTDGEHTGTRPTGSAEVQVPASLRGGLALFHAPVMPERDPLTGWALGPDGWSCVRHLGADFDTMASGLTIRSAGAGRAAAASCNGFGCPPAVGSDTGRFIAYGSKLSGGDTSSIATQYGVPGTTACSYLRPFRAEDGVAMPRHPGPHRPPPRAGPHSGWLDLGRLHDDPGRGHRGGCRWRRLRR